jgi:hypothetical protein
VVFGTNSLAYRGGGDLVVMAVVMATGGRIARNSHGAEQRAARCLGPDCADRGGGDLCVEGVDVWSCVQDEAGSEAVAKLVA